MTHAYIVHSSSKTCEHFWFPKRFPASKCRLHFSVNCWDKYTIWPFVCLLFIVYFYAILCFVLNSSMPSLFAVFSYGDANKLEPIQRKLRSFSSYPLWLNSCARVYWITDVMRFKATSWCPFASVSSWDQIIWRCLFDSNSLEFISHSIMNFSW
jgi:hypothetical protein